MNANDLVHPDDDFTREWLQKEDWEYAQRQLDEGENPSVVKRRLHDWSRQYAYEMEAECAEYNHCIEADHH